MIAKERLPFGTGAEAKSGHGGESRQSDDDQSEIAAPLSEYYQSWHDWHYKIRLPSVV